MRRSGSTTLIRTAVLAIMLAQSLLAGGGLEVTSAESSSTSPLRGSLAANPWRSVDPEAGLGGVLGSPARLAGVESATEPGLSRPLEQASPSFHVCKQGPGGTLVFRGVVGSGFSDLIITLPGVAECTPPNFEIFD